MNWLLEGFANLMNINSLLICLGAAFVGTMVGVLPGLGPGASVALLFPFTMFMTPANALIAVGGIYYGAMFGGSITSILLNVPGEVASICTAIDGHPLAVQGRGAQAIAICILSSFFGGMLSLASLAFMGVAISKLAFMFGPFEYFALMMFSICCAAGLGKGSLIKGFSSAALGILLAMIGVDTETAIFRFTYGQSALFSGIQVIAMVVGIFGISEVMLGIQENAKSISTGIKYKTKWPSKREFTLSIPAAIKGALIGSFGGMLPGITPSSCTFLTYSIIKRTGKEKEKFGKGAIEGCAAVEAANNAAAVSGFIPLLTLGVPTTSLMAMIMSIMMIKGVIPGPTMFSTNISITGVVIAGFALGNVICLILNLPLAGMWAKVAELPYKWLAPVIVFLCVLGTIVINNSYVDLWVMVIFALIGVIAKKTGFCTPALIMGLILGSKLELYFRQCVVIGWDQLLVKPIALVIIALMVVIVIVFQRSMKKTKED